MGRREFNRSPYFGSLLCGAALAATPTALDGQAFFVDASVDQAYASDPLPSPIGFAATVGRTSIVGPLGLHAGFRTLHEGGADDVAQHCTGASCAPGPFDQAFSMRLIYVGISHDFRNPTDVYLNLGLNVGRSQETERLTHHDSGDEIEVEPAGATTLGGSLDLRLRPWIGPLRPVFSARFDHIFESSCPADGACPPARDVWSLSVGLSWVAPVR